MKNAWRLAVLLGIVAAAAGVWVWAQGNAAAPSAVDSARVLQLVDAALVYGGSEPLAPEEVALICFHAARADYDHATLVAQESWGTLPAHRKNAPELLLDSLEGERRHLGPEQDASMEELLRAFCEDGPGR